MAGPIICGVDDGDAAREAVRVALDLSDRFGSRLVLVHVAPADVPPGTSVVPHARPVLFEREKRDAELLLAEYAVEMSLGDNVQRRAVLGNPAESLVDVARRENAELLVLGSPRRRPLMSALLGSVSTEVVGSAPCPVVIVPAGAATGDASHKQTANRIGMGG